MGKQKYPISAGGVTVTGERTKRNNTKSGKQDRRNEVRRLEAIERQVRNIQALETALEKAKDKTAATKELTDAQLTLQKIRGGVPHRELVQRFATKESNVETKS